LSVFNARVDKAFDFTKKLFYSRNDVMENTLEERESTFLDAFVEFIEADFPFLCSPQSGIQR